VLDSESREGPAGRFPHLAPDLTEIGFIRK
jgi:hypothetical protein